MRSEVVRFPQPRDLWRGGAFSNRRDGGRREGAPLSAPSLSSPEETVAQRPPESPGLSRSPLDHPIPPLRDRSGTPDNGEGANPLPPGPRMRKFPCKCQADHRHRASHGGDKCKFLWRRRGCTQDRDTTEVWRKSLPRTLPRSGVSPGVQTWIIKRAFQSQLLWSRSLYE